MNSYERVMNTIGGLPADRVPVLAVLGIYGGRLIHSDPKAIFTDARKYADSQGAVQKTFGIDMILTPFEFTSIAEAFGGEIAWFADQAPNLRKPAATSIAEALKLPLPDTNVTGRLPVVLESIRLLSAQFKGTVPLFAPLPGPGALPVLMMGMEAWMDVLLFDFSSALALLEYTENFCVDWGNALLAAGADGLIVVESMASAEIMPRSIFEPKLLPSIQKALSRFKGPLVFHHGGGSINHIIDLVPALPNTVGALVGSKDSLDEARKLVGPDFLLAGNLDNLGFAAAGSSEIYAKSLSCLTKGAGRGHFMLANSGADIPLATAPETIKAMLNASAQFSGSGGLSP